MVKSYIIGSIVALTALLPVSSWGQDDLVGGFVLGYSFTAIDTEPLQAWTDDWNLNKNATTRPATAPAFLGGWYFGVHGQHEKIDGFVGIKVNRWRTRATATTTVGENEDYYIKYKYNPLQFGAILYPIKPLGFGLSMDFGTFKIATREIDANRFYSKSTSGWMMGNSLIVNLKAEMVSIRAYYQFTYFSAQLNADPTSTWHRFKPNGFGAIISVFLPASVFD